MDYNVNERSFRTLKSLDSSAAFEAERQVKELVTHPGWQLVVGLMAEAREDVVLHLTKGLLDHPQMARLSGIAEGLDGPQQAVNALTSLAERWREELANDVEALAGREQGG